MTALKMMSQILICNITDVFLEVNSNSKWYQQTLEMVYTKLIKGQNTSVGFFLRITANQPLFLL